MKKSLLIGLAVLVLAAITGGVVYASELDQIADNVESNIESSFDSVESTFDNIESKFDNDNDDYEHEAMHEAKSTILEDGQITQEEIDALEDSNFKTHLQEEFVTELEDGVVTAEELQAHKVAKHDENGEGHKSHGFGKKGRGHNKGSHSHNELDGDDL
jgi:cell shape-determining protein MreC